MDKLHILYLVIHLFLVRPIHLLITAMGNYELGNLRGEAGYGGYPRLAYLLAESGRTR
jgi:hypothetical protein